MKFNLAFGVGNPLTGPSLLTVLRTGGGGITAVNRHAVSALLGAALTPSFGYPYTTTQVIAMYQAAVAGGTTGALGTLFEGLEEPCPVNAGYIANKI
jgi:hypothetical protein